MLQIENNDSVSDKKPSDTGVFDLISQIDEFQKMSEYMHDEHLDEALSNVVKLMLNPAVPAVKAPRLIVQLSAISAILQMKAKWYMTVEKGKTGSIEHAKKEIYSTVSDRLDVIIQALKYSAK